MHTAQFGGLGAHQSVASSSRCYLIGYALQIPAPPLEYVAVRTRAGLELRYRRRRHLCPHNWLFRALSYRRAWPGLAGGGWKYVHFGLDWLIYAGGYRMHVVLGHCTWQAKRLGIFFSASEINVMYQNIFWGLC